MIQLALLVNRTKLKANIIILSGDNLSVMISSPHIFSLSCKYRFIAKSSQVVCCVRQLKDLLWLQKEPMMEPARQQISRRRHQNQHRQVSLWSVHLWQREFIYVARYLSTCSHAYPQKILPVDMYRRILSAISRLATVFAAPACGLYLFTTCPTNDSFDGKVELKRVLRG